jgi:hypothetical protein
MYCSALSFQKRDFAIILLQKDDSKIATPGKVGLETTQLALVSLI